MKYLLLILVLFGATSTVFGANFTQCGTGVCSSPGGVCTNGSCVCYSFFEPSTNCSQTFSEFLSGPYVSFSIYEVIFFFSRFFFFFFFLFFSFPFSFFFLLSILLGCDLEHFIDNFFFCCCVLLQAVWYLQASEFKN